MRGDRLSRESEGIRHWSSCGLAEVGMSLLR
jgi:hypothetical protein